MGRVSGTIRNVCLSIRRGPARTSADNEAAKIACTHPCRKATVIIGVAEEVNIAAVPNSQTSKMAEVVVTGPVGLEVTTIGRSTTKEATIIAITTNNVTIRSHLLTTAALMKVETPQRAALQTTCLIITAETADLRNVRVVRVVLANKETVKIAVVVLNIQVPIRITIDAKIPTI